MSEKSQNLSPQIGQLIEDLDKAIAQAIENPISLLGSAVIGEVEAGCELLRAQGELWSSRATAREGVRTADSEALLWVARQRAGRLQMLIDSAARFYSSCFSPSQPAGLDYSVHGEWGVAVTPSHLTMDC